MKNLLVANLEDNSCLIECVNRVLKVMRFTIHTGLKLTPFELHHGKPRTELTNLVKDGKSFLSDWTELSVSAEKKRDDEGDVTNYLVMAKTMAEEKAVDKQPKKKNSVSKYHFKLVEKNYDKKSLEGKFQKKIQTAISGTEHTVTTESGKVIQRKHISEPVVIQTEKKKRAWQIGDKITPKNRHCLRGVDGKYIQWNEILHDILNGKLKIIQKRTRKPESESESEGGEIDFKMENPDTSERNGYKPISTNLKDELKLQTDGEIPTGENETKYLETEKTSVRSNRKCIQPNLYGGVRYTKIFWV